MLTAFYTVTTISLVIACGFAVYGRNRRGLVFARAVGYLALSALINMVLIAALLSIFVTASSSFHASRKDNLLFPPLRRGQFLLPEVSSVEELSFS